MIWLILCLALLISSAAVALDQQWPIFRFDEFRQGRNPEEKTIYPGAGLDPKGLPNPAYDPNIGNFTLHWPRRHVNATQVPEFISENERDPKGDYHGIITGDWYTIKPETTWNQHGDNFLVIEAVIFDTNDEQNKYGTTHTAYWALPATYKDSKGNDQNVPADLYRIYVWIPSPPTKEMLPNNLKESTPTTSAQYILHTAEGDILATLNHTSGGAWVLLGNRPYKLDPSLSPDVSSVELLNATPDYLSKIVVADSVMFVRATDFAQGEIYSSPAVWWVNGPTAINHPNDYIMENGGIYVGKVFPTKKPGAQAANTDVTETNEEKMDFGHVECVTGWHVNLLDPDEPAHQTYRWIYPFGVSRWSDQDAEILARPAGIPVGPIWGGVYSSPALYPPDNPTTVFIAGADGQVYALDSKTGALIWSGPGQTVDNPPSTVWTDNTGALAAPDYMGLTPGDAFFGPGYLATSVQTNGTKEVSWNFDDLPNGFYRISVWLPPRRLGPDGQPIRRARSATYSVVYYDQVNGKDVEPPFTAVIDQNNDGWVTLPAPSLLSRRAFWKPKKVTLTNKSLDAADYDSDKKGYDIVADAIRATPERLSSMTYSSPVIADGYVFVGDTGGRMWRLDMDSQGKSWTGWKCWPKVRTKWSNDAADEDESPLNSIVASPAVWEGPNGVKIVFGTTDSSGSTGRFYSISTNLDNPNIGYDPTDETEVSQPVTSSMAVAATGPYITQGISNKAIVATREGRIFSFEPGTGRAEQIFPTNLGADIDERPVGQFNFSSPAIRPSPDLSQPDRIYIGSADSKLYAFDVKDSGGTIYLTKAWVKEDPKDTSKKIDGAAGLLTPIQSSVACTGHDTKPWLFVGDMAGRMWWVQDWNDRPGFVMGRAFWETDANMLFSSPAVLNGWLFVGGSDGLVYAWSAMGLPEGWAEATEAYGAIGEEPGTSVSDVSDQDLSPMVNAWHDPVRYDNCEWWLEYAECAGYKVNESNNPSDCDFTKGLPPDETGGVKKRCWLEPHDYAELALSAGTVRVEWGEKIRLLAWNLAKTANNPRFTMTSRGEGQQAGTSQSERANVIGRYNPYSHKTPDTTESWMSSDYRRLKNDCADVVPDAWARDFRNQEPLPMWRTCTGNPGDPGYTCEDPGKQPTCYPLNDWAYFTKSYAKYLFVLDSSNGSKPQTPGMAYTFSFSYRGQKKTVEYQQIKGSDPARYEAVEKTSTFTAVAIIPTPESVKGTTNSEADAGNFSDWEPQPFGINNPLGINTGGSNRLGWEEDPPRDKRGRNASDSTINGNGSSQLLLDLGDANHGLDSAPANVGMMDRSSLGLTGMILDKFRMRPTDLRWQGGPNAVINPLWGDSMPPMNDSVANISPDYPDISSSRMTFVKQSDNQNPTYFTTILIPCERNQQDNSREGDPDLRRLIPDPISTWINVPKYQPANTASGYGSRVYAYVDSNNNNRPDLGVTIFGRPTTYAEAYREFFEGLAVLPDFRMKSQEETLDVGAVPHGFGMNMGFDPWTSDFQPWFKELTVHNIGNVNLKKITVARMPLYSQSIGIYDTNGDGLLNDANGTYPLSGYGIVTSLDQYISAGSDYPHNLKKPRPDTDPVLLKVLDPSPDSLNPWVKPRVSIAVPISQPAGTYSSRILVFADENGNDKWDWQSSAYGIGGNPEAAADPSSALVVRVRESRLTDGMTAGELPQVDNRDSKGLFKPPSGDVHPAAFRMLYARNQQGQAVSAPGDLHLFWSSNRYQSDPPSPDDPWFIYHSVLPFKLNSMAAAKDPRTQWELAAAGESAQWWTPVVPALHIPPLSDREDWDYGWPIDDPADPNDAIPGTVIPSSVRHTNPSVAQDPLTGQAWLFWQGQATKTDGNNNYFRENRVFYTSLYKKEQTEIELGNLVFSFTKDFTMVKYGPRGLVYHDDPNDRSDNPTSKSRTWVFWYGGDAGKFSLFYNYNDSDLADHKPEVWTEDVKLTTPSNLASVAEPIPVLRRIGNDPEPKNNIYIDIIYAGVSKHGQNTDIYMTRYKPRDHSGRVRLEPQRFPRIGYGGEDQVMIWERLQRDPDANVYYSRHISWVAPSGSMSDANRPIVTVVFPDEQNVYTVIDNNVQKSYDEATGLYAYTYPEGDTRAQRFGQVLLDTSAGTVRFTQPLIPKALVRAMYTPRTLRLNAGAELKDDSIDFPSLTGQYSWRWTANHAGDGAPFALIEKSPNLDAPNLALPSNWPRCDNRLPKPVSVDRYWVFWRRPHSEVRATTVYYKTMRLGVQLSRPLLARQKPNPLWADSVTVTGANGPYEIVLGDVARGIGGRIYFTEVDEGSEVTITYTYTSLTSSGSVTETARITWMDELPETALLGDQTMDMVNEGQLCAVPDPPERACNNRNWLPTSMWLFWASTRSGSVDLYYETISPNFQSVLQKR